MELNLGSYRTLNTCVMEPGSWVFKYLKGRKDNIYLFFNLNIIDKQSYGFT